MNSFVSQFFLCCQFRVIFVLHIHTNDLYCAAQVASGLFQELDDRINYVATKVVHLGDQLEGINTPRSRAIEAQELMKYFEEFASLGEPTSLVFIDPSQVQLEATMWSNVAPYSM